VVIGIIGIAVQSGSIELRSLTGDSRNTSRIAVEVDSR
jgi:hypothetical protein